MPDNTNFGRTGLSDGSQGQQGQVTAVSGGHDKPGLLVLQCHDASNVLINTYLWVDSTGDLRISPTIPTDQDANGTVVGTQL